MRRRAVGAAAIVASLAGCATGSGTASSPQQASSPSTSATSSATTEVGRAATFRDNGATVVITVGDSVTVRLPGTYWQFAPVDHPAVLRAGRPVAVARKGRTVPGSGAGTTVFVVHARASGSATINATRRSCGEALRCTPAQSRFRLFVQVKPRA